MHASRWQVAVLLVAAAVMARCGSVASEGADGGTSADASQVTQDAGPEDAGRLTDAGTFVDAGDDADAGEAGDAGDVGDAGELGDAGEVGDAGSVVGTTLTASLSGAQVVPPVTTSATGSATFVIDGTRKKLTYTITHDVVNATEVHIRIGVAGQNGLSAYSLTPVSQSMSGSVTIPAVHASQLEAGNWHLQVHSQSHPTGEIRGQIEAP